MYTTSISAHDDHGFWIVTATGGAGTWYCATRTLEIGTALAGYASMIGELPRGEWQAPMGANEIQSMEAPFAVSWQSEERAMAEFARLEGIFSAALRGNLLEAQEACPDAVLTDADYSALEQGGVIYPPRVSAEFGVMLDTAGVPRLIRDGVRYTDASGNHYTVVSR